MLGNQLLQCFLREEADHPVPATEWSVKYDLNIILIEEWGAKSSLEKINSSQWASS